MGWNSGPCESNTCVGIGIGTEAVVIWDTKLENTGILTFSREEWAEFIERVKAGEYDL